MPDKAELNLKDTILTPRTDFPMKANLTQREKESLERWYQSQPDGSDSLYQAIRNHCKGRPHFILHDGPPYANGDAHTGTGMNKILKDFVVRYKTMQGFDVPYIPGWDCHGLPIEHKVIEKLGGQKPEDMSALEVRKRCREFAEEYIDRQREQFKRTLTLGRWEKPYLTLDPIYEGGVLDCYSSLMEKGYVVRNRKPVHWSWAARSALAEAELEYEERTDPSIYVKFQADHSFEQSRLEVIPEAAPLLELLAQNQSQSSNLHFVIWTTTPWTLPANLAIACKPDALYGFYQVEDQIWVLAEALAERFFGLLQPDQEASEQALQLPHKICSLQGKELVGTFTYSHVLWGTSGKPLLSADYVTLEDGTGLVHTAPGHGAEDFETGKKQGLPIICPVDERGCYYEAERLREELCLSDTTLNPQGQAWFDRLQGQHILKANKLIIQELVNSGEMIHWHEFKHSYPHCWRTHKPVIFRATEQWFVQIDHEEENEASSQKSSLRSKLLEQVNNVDWYPAWGEKRIRAMIENRPDWCISRQRYWGIPIPAFRDQENGKLCIDQKVVNRIADLVREHGSDIWFDDENWPVEKLLPDQFRAPEFRGRPLSKMMDIFDVWFESGASHRGVVLAEDELRFPADLYLEGDDQHRGWFQVSMILATATQNTTPFKECLTSAFVVDEKGQKGSKSKGNIFAIDWGCEQVGADLLRLYFASVDTSSPIPVTLELVREKTAGLYRTLRNTLRVMLGNLNDFDPEKDLLEMDQLSELDGWVLSRLHSCIQEVSEAMERYHFHVASRRFIDFCNRELSAFYIDVTKDALYCESQDSKTRRSIQSALYYLSEAIIKLLAPFCPHTADEAWALFPQRKGRNLWSVQLESYPRAEAYIRKPELEAGYEEFFKAKAEIDRVLDRMRKEKILSNSTAARIELAFPQAQDSLLQNFLNQRTAEYIATLLSASLFELKPELEGEDVVKSDAGFMIRITPSPFAKCERCWNHWESVEVREEYDQKKLCERCFQVLEHDYN